MLSSFAGNREIKDTVRSFVTSGRFPHALIIEGEPGSGRRTLARMIAAAAVCDSPDAPCGRCRACTLTAADGHCDVLTYAPDGAVFKVETVREIRAGAYVMPIEAKRRVCILLECEKMNEQAQNALLKTLEEPPEFLVFILVCRSAAALLPTVRSRCVTLTVTDPDADEAAAYIETRTGKPADEIGRALEAAHGRIGTALELLGGEADREAESAGQFFECVAGRDRFGALKILYGFEKDRAGYGRFLSELRLLLGRLLKQDALGQKNRLTPSGISRLLELTRKTDETLKTHVGQPLSLQLSQTAFCAEIFTDPKIL